eukprot:284131_1
MANDDEKYALEGHSYCCLRNDHFKVMHVSNHDQYSPTDEYLNQSLQLTNDNYSLQTLPDRTKLPDDLFDGYDTILLTTWSSIDEAKLGNLVANAIDKGANVVILLFSNTLSWQHPKGRFMQQTYNATTRVAKDYVQGNLGQVYKPKHPIMTNVNNITMGSETRMSMGKIPEGEQQHIDRIADWNDGNVFIAIRHNKTGLVTEITRSFGTGGAKGDAKQLLNNALRLRKGGNGLKSGLIPVPLVNVINKSNFRIMEQIQQQFTTKHVEALQENSDFEGWDNVYKDISIQFAKILSVAFDNVSSQIESGTQQQINRLTQSKNKCLEEIESTKRRYKEMNIPAETVEQCQAPLLEHIKTLQARIDEWKAIQVNTKKLVNNKQ